MGLWCIATLHSSYLCIYNSTYIVWRERILRLRFESSDIRYQRGYQHRSTTGGESLGQTRHGRAVTCVRALSRWAGIQVHRTQVDIGPYGVWSCGVYHATLTEIRIMSTLELESLIFLGILFVFHQNIKNFQIRINVRELIHRALLFTGMIRMWKRNPKNKSRIVFID